MVRTHTFRRTWIVLLRSLLLLCSLSSTISGFLFARDRGAIGEGAAWILTPFGVNGMQHEKAVPPPSVITMIVNDSTTRTDTHTRKVVVCLAPRTGTFFFNGMMADHH
uniref:Putative secreted peptide n=1 Tax=Anopheles braziliensis TaxID=58242 RepID=A0A2M3ZWI7_9DIPT